MSYVIASMILCANALVLFGYAAVKFFPTALSIYGISGLFFGKAWEMMFYTSMIYPKAGFAFVMGIVIEVIAIIALVEGTTKISNNIEQED